MAYSSEYTGPEIDAAIGTIRQKADTWDGKQDQLRGLRGQVVGFDLGGKAVPISSKGEGGVPSGGATGQALVKRSDTDYDTEWQDQNGGVTSFNTREGAVVPQKGDYTAEQVGAVPTSRTVNGKALSANITLSASDVKARPSTWTPTAADVGALPIKGGTLTGALTLSGAPAADLHAATKKYVDDAIKTSVLDSWNASY